MCCGHKEYATPLGRKIDPDFDMPAFRREVSAFLSGKTPTPPIPSQNAQQRPTLRRGAKGPAVAEAQRLLNLTVDGAFGPNTEAALRVFQRGAGLVPDGILGPKTWERLSAGAPPARAAPAPVQPGDGAEAAAAHREPEAGGPVVALPLADTTVAPPKLQGRTAIGPGGERFASVSGKGFYSPGETPLAAWVATGPSLPPTISDSVVNVVAAMSTVEGGMEAINSYDNAHLSFGVFQWTAGSGDDPGEFGFTPRDIQRGRSGCFSRMLRPLRPRHGNFKQQRDDRFLDFSMDEPCETRPKKRYYAISNGLTASGAPLTIHRCAIANSSWLHRDSVGSKLQM